MLSQTVPHWMPKHISTLPSYCVEPPTSLTSPLKRHWLPGKVNAKTKVTTSWIGLTILASQMLTWSALGSSLLNGKNCSNALWSYLQNPLLLARNSTQAGDGELHAPASSWFIFRRVHTCTTQQCAVVKPMGGARFLTHFRVSLNSTTDSITNHFLLNS